jgi:hypothetical protein
MKSRKKLKMFGKFILIITLCILMSTQVFAASGIASMQANRAVTFSVPVTGSTSLMAHVKVISRGFASGQMVAIQVRKPNGQTALAGADSWLITSNGTMYFNFMLATSGDYQVSVVPTIDNSWFTIIVAIEPGYY